MTFKKERDRLRLSYEAEGWQTIPLDGKEPRSGLGWSKPYKGDWRDSENIGVVLGAKSGGLVDLDLDWPEAVAMAGTVIGASKVRCFGRPSSPFSHMLFTCPGLKRTTFTLPKSFMQFDLPGEHPLMVAELRGDGCYTMFPGSKHPSGEVVAFENDAHIRHVEQEKLERVVGMVAFAAVCARFWPGDGARHDAALAFAGICKRADISHEICAAIVSKITAGDREQQDRLKAVATTYAADKPVSGWKKLREVFSFPPDATSVFADWLGIGAVHAVEHMNARYAVIKDGSKVRVGTLTPDPTLGRERWDLMTQTDFSLLECHSKAAKLWLESPLRRFYRHGFIFDPTGTEHEGFLNLWRGWRIEPVAGSWAKLDYHIRRVLCAGNEEHARYVLNWLAWMFQNPNQRAEVAIVFRGAKGTGKGLLGRALLRACGQHGIHVSSSKMLTGDFNSHLRDCIFLFADEAFWAGDKPAEGQLKRLTTEDTLLIEGKGKDAVQTRNMLHILMASNEEWVVPASTDERRWAVFDVSDVHQQDGAYFDGLFDALTTELPAFMHDCMARDLDGWHPRKDVPRTTALQEQAIESEDPARALLRECLETGMLPGTHPTYNAPGELCVYHFMEAVKRRAFGNRVTHTSLGRLLGKIPGVTKDTEGRVFKGRSANGSVDLGRSRRYLLPSLEATRRWFDPRADWGDVDDWQHAIEVTEVQDGPYM